MSNLGAFGGAKTSPWSRNNNSPAGLVNQSNLQQQIMSQGAFGGVNATGMVQLQQQHQQQVLQNAMNMQQQNLSLGLQQLASSSVAATAGLSQQIASNPLFQQVGAVSYPNPRALNPSAFQTQVVSAAAGVQPSNNNSGPKQRVFTGTVTKVHDNFGFVDDDVFFQTTACAKGSNPMVGDRVLVEATYNPNMPFKWNATRMQVLPTSAQNAMNRSTNNPKGGSYNSMSQLSESSSTFGKGGQRSKASIGGRGRERSRTRDDEDENDRKRRREDRIRDRERDDRKSPLRRRSRSPKSRRRSRIVPRYMVQIPKISLDLKIADVLETRRRYANLYIPSDFFCSYFRWVDAFLPDKPLSLNKPCSFHVMNKEVDPIAENNAVLEPPDADYLFSAKVMLMSVSGLEDMYQRCCALAEDNKRDSDSEDRDYVHPTRLVQFLVGVRGKNETMAIGGPWSKSLDGENPEKDPSVLIKTAIRTCKALTGIDLSPCTQWYRFVELYYRRAESVHRGRTVPARVETVVLFLPDVWSCLPTRLEWDALIRGYQRQLEARITEGDETPVATPADEKDEEIVSEKLEPTHYSELDTKTMSVAALRNELKARNLNAKGLKSQLVARLQKALKAEAEKGDGVKEETADTETENTEDKKSEGDEKKIDEKERQQLEKRYALPEQPHIIVHPNRVAKSGKFDCTVMSLSLLLDYRPEDTKEHSFEVSLFAELFNEMLMRDFGFNIYKALYELPEKAKEKEEKKKKEEEKKKEDKDEKEKSKEKEDEKKKDDKKKDEKEAKKDEIKDKKEESKEKEKKSEDAKEDKKGESRDEKKKDSRKDDKRSEKDDDSEDDDDYDDDDRRKSDRDKKRKERPKMYTKDRNLLLSFIYFDQTHCGYIFEKDMEDLLFTLGLNLSRAQVRKLVGKVVSRDSLHYRKLTDKPKDEDFIVIDDSEKDTNVQDLAIGNKNLLPIFKNEQIPVKKTKIQGSGDAQDACEEGLIMFRGAMVDVSKLMAQLERSEKTRVETEACMVDLKTENNRLSEKNSKHSSTIKSLNSELKEYKDKLKSTEDTLSRISACSKLFQSTLIDIRDKIDPVLKSTAHIKEEVKRERDGDRERKHEESKSRWERNPKEKDLREKEKEEKEKEKEREKEKEKEREKEKEKEREKEKEKEKVKEKEKEKDEAIVVDEAKDVEMKSS